MTKKLGWLIGLLTLLGSGGYVFVYLYRWEFHRTLISGVIFLAAEIALAAGLILRQMRKVTTATGDETVGAMERLLYQQLQEHSTPRDHFAWLRPERTNVFIPILLGGGVLLSAAAWLVEKLAGRSVDQQADAGIARELGALELPDTLVPRSAGLALPTRPGIDGARALLRGPRPR